MATFYQHGDVLIKKVGSIPKEAKKKKPSVRGHVLAEGEVTGHAHTVDPKKADLFEFEGKLFLHVKEEVIPKHEEHTCSDIQTIPPGEYEIGIVQEVDPMEKEVRDVRD